MKPMHLIALSIFSAALISSCSARHPAPTSEIRDHLDTPTDLVAKSDVAALIATVKAALESGAGNLPIVQVANVMPMVGSERQRINNNFPVPMKLTCDAASVSCSGSVSGTKLSVQMSFSVGLISNPTLDIASGLTTRIKLRSATEVEICDIVGMSVRKFFVTKTVEGINLKIVSDKPQLIVDAGDSSDNFTCQ